LRPNLSAGAGPLAGMRVLELGSFIAGPFAGQLLGDYGAEVIKIEPPRTGDPMRRWGVTRDGASLWWPTIARNKKSVAVDLRSAEGRAVVRELAAHCDVVIENFKPGRLNSWGLGYDVLSSDNPRLIMVHVSGFGQTGPRSFAAGFGSIGEAYGGLRNTTGEPDRRPARVGISLGDALAGLFAVIGATTATAALQRTGVGQEVDVAIYEAVFALMESTLADYELGGVTRTRSGAVLPGVAPSNSYATADGAEVLIAANADAVFTRLCAAMGSPDLAVDERFRTHTGRGERMAELDALIETWTSVQKAEDVLTALDEASVPASRVFTVADILTDAQYQAREMIQRRESSEGWQVPMSGVVPRFTGTPGRIESTGPMLGEHSRDVLVGLGVVSPQRYDELIQSGVVDPGRAP
jgi:crotonobetainyl-CoA:carnitine CoA-transferase CaiB-like acyl-CoA transferase